MLPRRGFWLAVVCVLFFVALFFIVPKDSTGDEIVGQEKKYVRESIIAGTWYPGSRSALIKQLDSFFGGVEDQGIEGIRAIIVPHAGYVYSGQVAAYAFKQIQGKKYKRVIILAPSHHYPLNRAAVSNHTHYSTPLGEVKVSSITHQLPKESNLVAELNAAQSDEHSAEIEVPFLQYSLKDFEIIPIIVGRMSSSEIDKLADLLIRKLDEETLIVASTDLSHYHPYDEAVSLDKRCIDAIVSLDMQNASRCEMCGYYPVLVLMRIAQKMNWSTKLLKYMNSGDVTGNRSGVVGYASIVFYKSLPGSDRSELSVEQKKYLLKLARDTIELYVREKKVLEPKTDDPVLKENKGVFVTLEKHGQLRGCIGHLEPVQPLYLDVRDNAINAATKDPRFRPVTADELSELEIEVSVLSLPELIEASSPEEYLAKIQPGLDGIIIDYRGWGATYLPQVWEMIPDKEDFLSSLCQKAGVSGDCWRKPEAKIYRYRVTAFKEGDFS